MKPIQTDKAPAAIGPYAQAVTAGGFMFTSGQIPLDTNGNIVEGDIQIQTKQVFSNLEAIVAAAGATLADTVKATVFLKDMNDFAAMNEVYAASFGDHKPARSTIEVARLPRDVKVEIELIVNFT